MFPLFITFKCDYRRIMSTTLMERLNAIIDEARNGRMFVLVDDESRENEGDLVIPAQMATPDAINFMARHGPARRLRARPAGTRGRG